MRNEKKQMKIAAAVAGLLLLASCENWILTPLMNGKGESGPTYYIAADGSDSAGDGTKSKPWYSPQKAVNAIKAGGYSIAYIVINGVIGSGMTEGSGAMVSVEGNGLQEIVFKGGENGGIIDAAAGDRAILRVGAGANVTLAAGLTLTGAMRTGSGGAVLVEGGSLAMTGGAITGNAASSGGGVLVTGGAFAMSGGSITANTAVMIEGGGDSKGDEGGDDVPEAGGGVTVSGGVFTMTGGEIRGNAAGEGGDVVVSGGTFVMSGGIIYGEEENGVKENAALYVKSGTAKWGRWGEGFLTGCVGSEPGTSGGSIGSTSERLWFPRPAELLVYSLNASGSIETIPGYTNWLRLTKNVTITESLTVPAGFIMDLGDSQLGIGDGMTLTVNGTVNAKTGGLALKGGDSKEAITHITINGTGTISLSGESGSLLSVGKNTELRLEGNVTLKGVSDNNTALVVVNESADNPATFKMMGGAIAGNNNASGNGGGVYVGSGAFIMSGGVVYGSGDGELANSVGDGYSGAALYVESGGTAKWGDSTDIVTAPGGVDTRLTAP